MPSRLTVEITENAADDLEDIVVFIARDDPAAADRQVDAIRAAISDVLLPHPQADRALPSGDDRRLFVKDRYRIVYRVTVDTLVILRVVHSARNFDRILLETPGGPDGDVG